MIINLQARRPQYEIKGQLVLPTPTAAVSSVTTFVGTFISGIDTIETLIVPRAGNGKYISMVVNGGNWNDPANLIRLGVHCATNGTYSANNFVSCNQSRNTTICTASFANGVGYGVQFFINPSKNMVVNTVTNSASSATSKTTDYRVYRTGDFNFCYLRHYRTEDGVTTTLYHLLPATDGTNCGYLDTISNTFHPASGATVI